MADYEAIYLAGWDAYATGKGKNPYTIDTTEWATWCEGFLDCKEYADNAEN